VEGLLLAVANVRRRTSARRHRYFRHEKAPHVSSPAIDPEAELA